MKKIAILGSTGSIGTQALDICARNPEKYRVTALTAKSSREQLFAQVRFFRPEMAGLLDGIDPADIPEDLRFCRWLNGPEALHAAAAEVAADQVLVSIVGIAGLRSVMDALAAGRQVLLANKEALVTGGHFPVPAGRGAQPAFGNSADRQRRPFPNMGKRKNLPGHQGSGAEASELGYGCEDYRGFRQHVQQGAGDHGGPVAV